MVEIATSVPGVVASRMTGAGFGGCTVNLVRPDAVEALRSTVERDYPSRTGLSPMVLPVRATAGAGRLA
jgi:galactokinase